MTESIKGYFFDGKSSLKQQAWLCKDGNICQILDAQRQVLAETDSKSLTISARLGNTPRHITFPGGEKFQTTDQDALDALLPQKRSLIHTLESHSRFVVLSVILLLLFGWATVQYGIPATAKYIAHSLPENLLVYSGRESMVLLDNRLFSPSALNEEAQQQLHEHFAETLAHYPDLPIEVIFRKGGRIGANAFALPDGTVIFTDEMIELAEHKDELVAILAHEIGHVYHRHGIRQVIQGSMLLFGMSLIVGDMAAVSEVLVSIPLIMASMSYSRGFEREADDFAYQYLRERGMDTEHFANIMLRLQSDAQEQYSDNGWSNYLGTHPPTQERIEKFRQP